MISDPRLDSPFDLLTHPLLVKQCVTRFLGRVGHRSSGTDIIVGGKGQQWCKELKEHVSTISYYIRLNLFNIIYLQSGSSVSCFLLTVFRLFSFCIV